MENKRGLKINAEESFDLLKEYLGKKLLVDYFEFGLPHSKELILKRVNDYINILARFSGGITSLNFVGYESVIRRISSADGKVLYENKNISKDENFRRKSKKDLESLFYSTFGFKGLSSLEPILPNQSNNNSKNLKPWYFQLDEWPRRELFR